MLRTASTFAAIVAAILSHLLAIAAQAETARESATLALIEPAFDSSYGKAVRVAAALDGRSLGECSADPPPAKRICIEATRIAPGPHVLSIAITVRDAATLAQRTFRSQEKFAAGMRGRWEFNIRESAHLGAKQSEYLIAAEPLTPVDGCVPTIERLAGLSSCTAAGLGQVERMLATALSECQRADLAGTQAALERALVAVVINQFALEIRRCYDEDELRKLPERMTRSGVPNAWPPDTLTASSWRWAREIIEKLPESKAGDDRHGTVLEAVQQAVPEMAARLAVFDGISAAYLRAGVGPAMSAAQREPWNLDPKSPEGHRNILLLADPKRFGDAAYLAFAAAGVAQDKSLDCSKAWQSELLLRNFTHDRKLSVVAWRAVAAMMERTPPDGDYNRCDDALDPRLASPVPALERLHRLAELDCAPARNPRLRGKALEPFLRADFPDADPAMQARLKTEFAACLAGVMP